MYEVAKHNCVYVDEKVFNTITEVKNPQGILAIIEIAIISPKNIL